MEPCVIHGCENPAAYAVAMPDGYVSPWVAKPEPGKDGRLRVCEEHREYLDGHSMVGTLLGNGYEIRKLGA